MAFETLKKTGPRAKNSPVDPMVSASKNGIRINRTAAEKLKINGEKSADIAVDWLQRQVLITLHERPWKTGGGGWRINRDRYGAVVLNTQRLCKEMGYRTPRKVDAVRTDAGILVQL